MAMIVCLQPVKCYQFTTLNIDRTLPYMCTETSVLAWPSALAHTLPNVEYVSKKHLTLI